MNHTIIATVVSIIEVTEELTRLGARLRELRLARDDSMQVFAQRIGVSVPTLRAMERGMPTVAIGHWAHALWVLDKLQDLSLVLPRTDSPLDRARSSTAATRQRASRRR